MTELNSKTTEAYANRVLGYVTGSCTNGVLQSPPRNLLNDSTNPTNSSSVSAGKPVRQRTDIEQAVKILLVVDTDITDAPCGPDPYSVEYC